ncbi:hypothetical protein EMPS_04905 [Entomortierella parvispora]|uniref:Transcription activator GCR1-like domain-containing protein n=1 Tax=Entomortierella parvispora TaxID=205924 RepID=A0A9P3LVZ3_9FUNG|nr:hypothetical protein EMPS_04905 [Entomortierella parvispora]
MQQAAALDCLATAASNAGSNSPDKSPSSSSSSCPNLRGGRLHRSSFNSKIPQPPTQQKQQQQQHQQSPQHPHDTSKDHTVVILDVLNRRQSRSLAQPQSNKGQGQGQGPDEGAVQGKDRTPDPKKQTLESEPGQSASSLVTHDKEDPRDSSLEEEVAAPGHAAKSSPDRSSPSSPSPSKSLRLRNSASSDSEASRQVHAHAHKNLLETTAAKAATARRDNDHCNHSDTGAAIPHSPSSSSIAVSANGPKGTVLRLDSNEDEEMVAPATDRTRSAGDEDEQGENPPSEETRDCDMSEVSASPYGLARWQAWRRENLDHGSDVSERTMPQTLLQYLDVVTQGPSGSIPSAPTHPSDIPSHLFDSLRSWVDTFLKPVLVQWDHELRRQQSSTDSHLSTRPLSQQFQCQNCSTTMPGSSSQLHLPSHPLHLLPQQHRQHYHPQEHHLQQLHPHQSHGRQQDHAQRLSQLEQSHRETALIISQLQDRVHQLLYSQRLPQSTSRRSSEQPYQFDLGFIEAMDRRDQSRRQSERPSSPYTKSGVGEHDHRSQPQHRSEEQRDQETHEKEKSRTNDIESGAVSNGAHAAVATRELVLNGARPRTAGSLEHHAQHLDEPMATSTTTTTTTTAIATPTAGATAIIASRRSDLVASPPHPLPLNNAHPARDQNSGLDLSQYPLYYRRPPFHRQSGFETLDRGLASSRSDDLIELIARGLEEYHARALYGHHLSRPQIGSSPRGQHQDLRQMGDYSWHRKGSGGPEHEGTSEREHQHASVPLADSSSQRAPPREPSGAGRSSADFFSSPTSRGCEEADGGIEQRLARTKRQRRSSDNLSEAGQAIRDGAKRARSYSPPPLRPQSPSGGGMVRESTTAGPVKFESVGAKITSTSMRPTQDSGSQGPQRRQSDDDGEDGIVMDYEHNRQENAHPRGDIHRSREELEDSPSAKYQHSSDHLRTQSYGRRYDMDTRGVRIEDAEREPADEDDRIAFFRHGRYQINDDHPPRFDQRDYSQEEDRYDSGRFNYPSEQGLHRGNLHRSPMEQHREPQYFQVGSAHMGVSKTEVMVAEVLAGDLGPSRTGSMSSMPMKHSSSRSPHVHGEGHSSAASLLSLQQQQQQHHSRQQQQQPPFAPQSFAKESGSTPPGLRNNGYYDHPDHPDHYHLQGQRHPAYRPQPGLGDHLMSEDEEQDMKQSLVRLHGQNGAPPPPLPRQHPIALPLLPPPPSALSAQHSYHLAPYRPQPHHQQHVHQHLPATDRQRQHSSTTSHTHSHSHSHSHSLSQSSNQYHQHYGSHPHHQAHLHQHHHQSQHQAIPGHSNHQKTHSTVSMSAIYVMNRQVNTVPELWKEWTVGLGPGQPSIRQLEAEYGPSWRTSSSAANFFSRRLRIINEIQRMVEQEGLTEEEAVWKLEARREQGVSVSVPGSGGQEEGGGSNGNGSSSGPAGAGVSGGTVQVGMSLHRLSEILRKKQL